MKYEAHELANLFPMMDTAELQELADSIKANGQRDPIIIHEGKILDGRNRYAACQLAGVDPVERPFSGKDPLAYVMDKNLSRRHLTTSQRAMVAAKLANLNLGDAHRPDKVGKFADLTSPAVTQADAAKLLNVAERTVRDAKAIERDAPELAQKVSSGEITVRAAKEEIKERAKDPTDVMEQKETKKEVYTSETMAGLKRYWKKANKKERNEFTNWIKETK